MGHRLRQACKSGGSGIPGRLYQATAQQDVLFSYSLPAPLFTDGRLYTAVFDFTATVAEPVSVALDFGDRTDAYVLGSGLHVLALRCFWSTGQSTELAVSIDGLSAGDVVHTGRWRVFRSNHRSYTVNTILYGSYADAVLNSGDIEFAIGDKIVHTDAATGSPKGRQCTTAGQPGTWHEFGMISP